MARKLKQYVVVAPAAADVAPTPGVGNRVMLQIQNTGANPGLVRFGNPVRRDGGDMALTAGQFAPLYDIAESCPNDSLNFYSTAGTTFSVVEIVES